jgi:hypothetical protein
MFHLTGFGVRNLRSLRDTGLIPLKPITILVGKNSAGKSSFARILPLLKQSAERRRQAPVLWYGRLVDFGSFSDAVSSFAEAKEIEFRFQFSAPNPLHVTARYDLLPDADLVSEEEHIELRMTLGTIGDEDRTVLRRLELTAFGIQVRLIVENPRQLQLVVDDTPARIPEEAVLLQTPGNVLPQLHLVYRSPTQPGTVTETSYFKTKSRPTLGTLEVRAAISNFVHGNTSSESKDELADRLPLSTAPLLLRYCRELEGTSEFWRNSIEAVRDPDKNFNFHRLRKALVLYKFEALLSQLDDALEATCSAVSYLEPLRATAQRYYRREEVSIDELDPKGLNTAFFVQGLTPRDRDSLNEWLKSTFGFTLSVKFAGGHTSLHITTSENTGSRNIADVGLGYSQIAPVAIQLWAARRLQGRPTSPQLRAAWRARNRSFRSTVVIEQPELHLHPAYQAQLADVFAACVAPHLSDGTENRRPLLRIIAETHSPNLIGRLGELVNNKRLDPEDVQVIVFELDDSDNPVTTLKTARFDESGVLRNWPIGFFDH